MTAIRTMPIVVATASDRDATSGGEPANATFE